MLLCRNCSPQLFRWLLICLSLLTSLATGLPTNAYSEEQDENGLVKRAVTVSFCSVAVGRMFHITLFQNFTRSVPSCIVRSL